MKSHFFLLFLIIFLITSCQEKKDLSSNNQFDRMLRDSVYKREWIRINYENNIREECEVYITKERDTFVNQYKYFVNNVLDTLYSEYYELEISETDKEHFYKGKIKLYHKFNNLKKHNDKSSFFSYLSQNKDSIYVNKLEFDNPEFEFVFENFYDKRLQGFIYQMIFTESDSIRNGEEMLNLNYLQLAVDSHIYTDNISFKIMGRNEEFNPNKLKLEKTNNNTIYKK